MNKSLEAENINLKQEIKQLKEELEFMNKIFEHSTALVYQINRQSINNKPVWINTHKITLNELKKLDQNDYVKKLISEASYSRYDDYSSYR